jgi:dimethylaniline monooxygenase (N-oxide forming)
MIQRPDFWDTVAKNVHVHRNDIERLAHHNVILKDGPSLPMDILVCATGFVNSCPFFSASQRATLGLSHPQSADADAETEWTALEAEADKDVLAKYPKLAFAPHQSPSDSPSISTTPNRLYNCIAPLHDHSIAFVGNIYAPNGFRTAEVQAIWTTALFDGALQLPSEEAMRRDVAWVNAFMRRRYPTHGKGGNYLQYDMMGYIDRLLRQVGLTSHLKGWWTNWTFPMIAKDLHGTTQEYIEKYAEKRKGEESEWVRNSLR